jgi:hypothetical protein
MAQVRRPMVGRHSDSIDVTGPINMAGLDKRRHNLPVLPVLAIVVAILIVVAAVALLLAS